MLLMWKRTSLFLRKNNLLGCWDCLSLNRIGVLTLSLLLKLPPRKMEPWFILCSFFLLRLLCIPKPTIRTCMEYCCHVWAGDPSCYLKLFEKLQKKRICVTAGPSLAASLELFAYHQNVPSLIFFYILCLNFFTLVDVHLNWLNYFPWFLLPYSWGGLLVVLIDCMIFLSPFLDVRRTSIFNSFFHCTAKLCLWYAFLWPMI